MNLWNANCDAKLPKSKRELLRDLEIWERTQGGMAPNLGPTTGPNTIMAKNFDAGAWSTSHGNDFRRLIEDARKKKDIQIRAKEPEVAALESGNQPIDVQQSIGIERSVAVEQSVGIQQGFGIGQSIGVERPVHFFPPVAIEQSAGIQQPIGDQQLFGIGHPIGVERPIGTTTPSKITQATIGLENPIELNNGPPSNEKPSQPETNTVEVQSSNEGIVWNPSLAPFS